MLVPCKILKSFPYSEDGFTSKKAVAGETVGIPDRLVKGLFEAGFVGPPDREGDQTGKSIPATPENKMLGGAPENKAPDAAAAAEKAKAEAEAAARLKAQELAEAEAKAKEAAEAEAAQAASRTAETRAQQAAVVIPAEWQSLAWPRLRSLASQVSSSPIEDKAGAVAAIEAELKLRATPNA